VYPIDQIAFVVALEELDLEPDSGRGGGQVALDVGQRLRAVNRRLARAE
jgi:hypothetical protein